MPGHDDKNWLRVPPTNTDEIATRYDDWSSTYEAELVNEWRYDAPQQAAQLIASHLGPEAVAGAVVLDVGCGVGLTGRALSVVGVPTIDGVDVSARSLAMAERTGAYRSLVCHDFNAGPLPFADRSFTVVECVGVLSYATDPAALLADFVRVLVPGGLVVFSHRTDLWDEKGFTAVLADMQSRGLFGQVSWTEPMPYMPGNEDFADQVLVRYVSALTSS